MDLVALTIDHRKMRVEPGSTILDAAMAAGIEIPTLCHHPKLASTGACRMCVVEVQGAKALVTSCTTPVAEGMVVSTESDRVIAARRMIIDLLLANHPLDCLTCEQGGNCRLQDYAYQYGVKESQFAGDRKNYPVDTDNPFFERDYNKCIMCGRCVRICAEVVAAGALDYIGRGFGTKVGTAFDSSLLESPCVFCGNCIAVCPVGALQPKLGRGLGRVHQYEKVRTVCTYCGVGCAIHLHVSKGKVTGVSPADGPANEGLLCVKGRFGFDFLHHPDRLRAPLIREGDGFREATWDEALDLVACRFGEIKQAHGPGAFAGLASARCTNEENYLHQRFVRQVLGTNNIDHCARLCHASSLSGLSYAFGSGAMTNSIAEIGRADVIFVIGSNTPEAHPVIAMKVNEAKNRGARVIVADPRSVLIAERADIHLQQMPGTDIALLNGMMHVILREGLENREFIETRTEGVDALRETVRSYTPERAEAITGVPATLIERAARVYAGAGRATILYAMGITQHTTGHDNVVSIANLALLCGQVGRESTGVNPLRGQNNVQGACDMGALPVFLTGYQRLDDGAARRKFEEAWGCALDAAPGLTVVEMMNAALDGRIRAMYIMGENPMVSDPDINHVQQALDALDFLVVQDIFLTETARLADVVLPAAAFAEKEGAFTNTERRVQWISRAVAPPGHARADWEIICDLAGRMGVSFAYDTVGSVTAEIARLTPIYGGIVPERLVSRASPPSQGLQWPCPSSSHPGTPMLHVGKFSRGLGRFSAVEHRPPAEQPDAEYPFLFTTGRILYHYHTGSMTRRSKGLHAIRPEAYVEVHPDTARALGIEDGAYVRLRSRRGTLRVKAQVTGRTGPRVLFMPFHFAEAAANLLTIAALDPVAKIPELKVCAVSIEAEAAVPEEVPAGADE
jgi:formate dehydrogenase alpha subunit